MTERTVTVRLRMTVRDYVQGSTEAERMTRRLAAAQRDLAGSARGAGEQLDRTARQAEVAGRRTGRGMLYAAAGVAALGTAGAGLKVLPGLLTATATAGAALPPMLLGAASAGGVLITSMQGVGDAIKEVTKSDDPFADLAPNARALVAEVKALQPALSGVRQGFQQRTLAGSAENLRALATVTLPAVRAGLNELATDWSVAFRQITLAVTDPRFTGAFNTTTRFADDFFDSINQRIQPTIRSISTLVQSADPLARAFGQGLVAAIDRFNAKIESAARSGKLADFFEDGAEGAAAFLELAQGVAAITGQVIAAVQRQGGTLRDTAAALDAYLASGRSARDVAGIVDTLTAAYEGLRDVLGPLATVARDALADPGTAQALRTMFDVLAAGSQVVRVIFDLFQMLPDSMQATVLAAAALIVVGKRLSAGLLMVEGAAARAAARLTAVGPAGAAAGRGMTTAAAAATKAATALVALQLAGVVFDQFGPAAADAVALGRALETLAAKGEVSGEMARLFGANLQEMKRSAGFAGEGWIADFGRGLEGLIPPIRTLNELAYGGSFTGDKERFEALDAALTQYAQTTKDTAATQELWNRAYQASGLTIDEFAKLLPRSTEELRVMQEAAHAAAMGMGANSERAKLLAGSFSEASLAGKDLAATMDLLNGKTITSVQGQIALEAAYDKAKETIDENGRTVRKGTSEIDLNTEAGRENMQALLGIATAATQAADARAKETGRVEDGIPILLAARQRFIEAATAATGSAAAAQKLADKIFAIPDKDIQVTANNEDAINKLRAAGYEIKRLPNGKYVVVSARTAQAKADLAETKAAVDRINDRVVTVTVRTIEVGGRGNTRGSVDESNAFGGVYVPRQHGGATVAAAGGLLQPQIAPPGTRYQWAEPQTGGELFLPRRGIDRARGRALLGIAATWYDGVFVPMRTGGVVAAAQAGLVNAAPAPPREAPPSRTATRFDYAEAYLRVRDAVADLNRNLKENGRSFSFATAKGRENRQAVHSAIRAAQDAARVKFEETGSVKAANAAYDAHINRLRATLRQQKVSAATVRQLLAAAQRPTFALPPPPPPPPPRNSLANIAFTKSNIAAVGGLGDLADTLSLNRPGLNIGTPEGRENLLAIIAYLETAAAAAQDRYAQTKNARTATSYYTGLLTQLRAVLGQAGYNRATIDSLLSTYGRITLTPNERGGIYMAAGGLATLGRRATLFAGNVRPMYGWAEKSTGGEAFIPRLGDRQRGRELLDIAAGWYGGRFTAAGSHGGGSTTINNNLTVNPRTADLSIAELQGFLRQMDAEARVGRRR